MKNKTIIVTGAASGVGKATVQACRDLGATTTGLDISIPEDGSSLKLDVSDESAWAAYASSLESGSIDHLHLNAGIQIAPPEAPLSDYAFKNVKLENYRRMMGVNVDGVVFGLHHLLPKMKSGGSIVVTCSLAGITPYDVDPLYSMSKHAVTGLVRSLKRELREQGLRINALCPGGIDTNIIPLAQRENFLGDTAPSFMTPEAIAAEVIRLFDIEESGHTWAKVAESKPAWIIYPPGQKKKS